MLVDALEGEADRLRAQDDETLALRRLGACLLHEVSEPVDDVAHSLTGRR